MCNSPWKRCSSTAWLHKYLRMEPGQPAGNPLMRWSVETNSFPIPDRDSPLYHWFQRSLVPDDIFGIKRTKRALQPSREYPSMDPDPAASQISNSGWQGHKSASRRGCFCGIPLGMPSKCPGIRPHTEHGLRAVPSAPARWDTHFGNPDLKAPQNSFVCFLPRVER